MQGCYGQHGWKEFHSNRKNILSEFDKILEQTSNRPIQTAHGLGVEAYIRKWLAEFLPKKFGVTSGYIIPNLYKDTGKIYHYDIIIYNLLDSPVLWTEGNVDNSEQGKYRAIPAQHVIAVYEVKSRLTKNNVTEALDKLNQTREFSEQLNKNYSCGVIFIDLKESENQKDSIIKELHKGKDIFGFSGGIVLRYEGDQTSTGLISTFKLDCKEPSENTNLKPLAKPIDGLNIYLTEDGNLVCLEIGGGATLVCISENTWSVSKSYGVIYSDEDGYSVLLKWSRSNFSTFCINFLSALEGLPYSDKKRPSFGQVFDIVDRKKAPLQNSSQTPGFPFITVSLYAVGDNKKILIGHEEGMPTIEFWVEVENQGDGEAKISDDGFTTSCILSRRTKAVKSFKFAVHIPDNKYRIEDILNDEGLEFSYRLVYQTLEDEKEFFSVEKSIKISGSEIYLI